MSKRVGKKIKKAPPIYKGSIRYRVRVKAIDAKIASSFVSWMRVEHGPELLKVPGCLEYRVYKLSSLEVDCEYLFESREALDTYYEKYAAELRAKGVAKFSSSEIQLSRDESTLVLHGEAHSGPNF